MNQEAIKLIKEAIKHYEDKKLRLKGEVLSLRIKIEDAEKGVLKVDNIKQSLEAGLEKLEEADEKEEGGLKLEEIPALKIPREAILEPEEIKESSGTGEKMEEAEPGELLTGEKSAMEKIGDDIEEEIKEDKLTPEQRTQKSLDDATNLIERERKREEQRKKGWELCIDCNSNRVAPWNKKKICSKCQAKRKTSRPYKKR